MFSSCPRFAVILACIVFPLFSAEAQTDGTTLVLTNAKETFNQTFQKTPVWRTGGVQTNAAAKPLNDPTFSWVSGYIWDHPLLNRPAPWPQPTSNFPAWTSNGAADASPNGDLMAQIMQKQDVPLTWSGALNFSVRPMPAYLAQTIGTTDPKGYIGATINSFPYSQRYGVFAMYAKLPKGKGVWPAFWLLPVDKSWPPELDVMEVIGTQPTVLYTTLHTNIPKQQTSLGKGTDTHLDLSAAYHEYAVDWGPNQIRWYFDRKLVFTQTTPTDLRKPCYILANVAVGGPKNWGGAPDTSTTFPATMQVAYIKAWQRPEYGP